MMLPVKTITEHAHNLYRMSSNLRSIAYDLHYCPGSKNYRRQNKMTFSPELYIIALKKWMVHVLYIFNLYIYQFFFRKLKIMILAFHITLITSEYAINVKKIFKIQIYLWQDYFHVNLLLYMCKKCSVYFKNLTNTSLVLTAICLLILYFFMFNHWKKYM
jgi:hypothetical protein